MKHTNRARLLLPALLFAFLLAAPIPAAAEASLPLAAQEVNPQAQLLPLSLQEALCIALANSLDIEIQKYLPRINSALLLSQKGLFDPHVFFSATYVDAVVPLSSSVSVATGGLTSVEAQQWALTGGLTGAIISGLTYTASVTSENTPSSTITEFLGTDGQQQFTTVLTVSQPLLRNFGVDINTTGIRAAEKAKEASVYQLEQSIIDTLFAVETAYWNLVFTYENLRVQLNSLRLAQDLLRENEIRLRVGVVAPLDVLQSETGVAFREEQVIISRRLVEDASDALISIINLFPGRLHWDMQILPTDQIVIMPPVEYHEVREIALALRNRPELQALIKQREAAELQAKFAKNQLLPYLNLNASAGYIGLDSDFNPAFFFETPASPIPDTGVDPALDDLFSGDNFQWLLGFTFEMPLGRHFERGQYRAANLLVSQLDTSIQNVRLSLVQDVRSALREMRASWESVQASRLTTEFRRRSLEAQRARYQVGATTTFDLLQFEDELSQAQANELNAVVNYRIAVDNLSRATGTLLEVLNVRLDVDP